MRVCVVVTASSAPSLPSPSSIRVTRTGSGGYGRVRRTIARISSLMAVMTREGQDSTLGYKFFLLHPQDTDGPRVGLEALVVLHQAGQQMRRVPQRLKVPPLIADALADEGDELITGILWL